MEKGMKKLFLCIAIMAASLTVSAKNVMAEQIGVYVAPKIVYGLVQMKGVNHKYNEVINGVNHPEFYSLDDQTDSTFGGALAIGYDFNKNFNVPVRTELEYTIFSDAEAECHYTEADTGMPNERLTRKQIYDHIQTVFLNVYYDFETGTKFIPYIGAGIGAAFIKTEGISQGYNDIEGNFDVHYGSKNVTNFAWNIGAGVGYEIADNWTIDLGYRFVNLGSIKTNEHHERNAIDTGDDYVYDETDHLYQHQFALGIRYTF